MRTNTQKRLIDQLMSVRQFLLCWFAGLWCLMAGPQAVAQAKPATLTLRMTEATVENRSVSDWLMRMHDASRRRAYVGTFVVTAGASMSSARIWHVCDGVQQMERIESLSGVQRRTLRRNDQVMTFLPESRVAVAEKRDSLGLFPNLLQSNDSSIAQFYRVKVTGSERVAGFDADVVKLSPTDSLRFAYRVWTEKKTGLVVKLQTLDADDRVLEQSAFSELKLDAPVSMAKMTQMMTNTKGYQVEKLEMLKTTAAVEGWVLKSDVPGFNSMSFFKRSVGSPSDGRHEKTLQWIFSDGLASVSLFIEAYDSRHHTQMGGAALGATYTLTRRIGDWWLTAVGEVPPKTLAIFVQGLELRE